MSEELQTPQERPILFDREAMIATLRDDERFRALREALEEAERDMTEHVARVLMRSGRPLDQRKIDYLRGYYDGARHWTGGRMAVAKQRLDQNLGTPPDPLVDPRLKESDA